MARQIQIRRDTAANWVAANPILADGELGLEKDTGKFKIGNASDAWNSLSYSYQGEPNTASNLGTGEGLYASKQDVDLRFKSIKAAGEISLTADDTSITISGGGGTSDVQSFLDLNDTPFEYVANKYLRTTTSGLVYDNEYLSGLVYVQAGFDGEFSDGSFSHPFPHIYQAVGFINATYSGTDNVVVMLHPGTYDISYQLSSANTATKAIIGTSSKSVILRPTEALLGQPFFSVTHKLTVSNMSVYASHIPEFATTSGTIGALVIGGGALDDSNSVIFEDCKMEGFYNSFTCLSGANIYFKDAEIMDTSIAIEAGSGALIDVDNIYIEGCRDKFLYAHSGAEAYLADAELTSSYRDLTTSGTAIYIEGDGTYVELFGGTNIWGVDKNIHIQNSSTLRIDNCVVEPSSSSPGIDIYDDATLIIVNSRAPLSYTDISISDPTNVYINAFDSTTNGTVIGNGADVDQEIFSIKTGKALDPHFHYEPDHNVDFKAMNYTNPTSGENVELYASSVDGDVSLAAHPTGPNSWNNTANLGLVSIQDGVRRGWYIRKLAGSQPDLVISNREDVNAMYFDYSGDVRLNSGAFVNKILDEDDFASNDAKALVTQQSTKAFVSNYTYSSTALNAGQLDNRYYTEAEVDAITSFYVNTSGTTPLLADWDVGPYRVTASGFNIGTIDLRLTAYSCKTGIISGGSISIDPEDPTKVHIEAGRSLYFNASNDPENPIVEELSWPDTSIPAGISGSVTHWLGIYRTGPGQGEFVHQEAFTSEELRFIAVLGRYWTTSGIELAAAVNYKQLAYGGDDSFRDLTYALGTVNISGNVFTPSATSMKLDRTAGESFRYSANFENNANDPNIVKSNQQIAISEYRYTCYGWSLQEVNTTIDPNNYDLNGVKTSVPTDKWTIQRLFYYPVSDIIVMHYGQKYYDTKSLALDGIAEEVSINSGSLIGASLRAYVIVKQGTSSLTDVNQAIVKVSYGIDGLTSGNNNHGNLGGLSNDDHPQYLTTTRGDERYYTQTEIDLWRDAHPHAASGIEFINTDWNAANVQDGLEAVLDYTQLTIGTGRVLPETPIVQTGANSLLVMAGNGYISYSGQHTYVTWSMLPIDTTGKAEATYYLYVDTSGTVTESINEPDKTQYIYLGFYYHSGIQIGVISNNDIVINQAMNRAGEYMDRLGAFIYDKGGSISLLSGSTDRIISSACKVQRTFKSYSLTEVSSNDVGTRFLPIFYAPQIGWGIDFSMIYDTGGAIPGHIYNDTTASGVQIVGPCVFNNGSSLVTSLYDLTGAVVPGDKIFYVYDSIYTMSTVSGVSWTGSETEIALYYAYRGTTTTGIAAVNKALPFIPEGKFAKHRIARDVNNNMYFRFGTELFDTEDEAVSSAIAGLPESTEYVGVNISAVVATVTSGIPSLSFYDIRPLTFRAGSLSGGGGGSGSTPTAVDHGELSGLEHDDHSQYVLVNGQRNLSGKISYETHPTFSSNTELIDKQYADTLVNTKVYDHGGLSGLTDDDHTQYSKSDGTRNYTGIVSYNADKTFTADTQIISKKYVDDKVAASVVTDHGGLTGLGDDDHQQYLLATGARSLAGKLSYTSHPSFVTDTEVVDKKFVDDSINAKVYDHGGLSGLSDDDHTQYLNITRGDARYYTETEVNNLFTAHTTGDTHNGVYYTESEVEGLITTLSGVLQDQLDAQGAGLSYYAESNTLESTTSTTFQNKLTITFGSGVTGTYRIAYSMSFNPQSNNKDAAVRFYNTTNAVVLDESIQKTNSSENWFSFSGIVWVDFTGANKTFALQYAAITAPCAVRYARVEAWRKG